MISLIIQLKFSKISVILNDICLPSMVYFFEHVAYTDDLSQVGEVCGPCAQTGDFVKAIECMLIVPLAIFWWTVFIVVYVWMGCRQMLRDLVHRSQ